MSSTLSTILKSIALLLVLVPSIATAGSVFHQDGGNSQFKNFFESKFSPPTVERTFDPSRLFDTEQKKELITGIINCLQNRCTSITFPPTRHFHFPSCGHQQSEVPLPAAVWLFGSGLVAMGLVTKKRRQ